MKALFGFAVLVLSVFSANAQDRSIHFMSGQQQQVKYDTDNKLYFIDQQVNKTSEITIEKNIVSFIVGGKQLYTVYINNINLEPLENKMSFTMEGRDALSGKQVKIGFWFIAGELDEVSYTNESFAHSVVYKEISRMNDTRNDAVAFVRHFAK